MKKILFFSVALVFLITAFLGARKGGTTPFLDYIQEWHTHPQIELISLSVGAVTAIKVVCAALIVGAVVAIVFCATKTKKKHAKTLSRR